MIQYKKGNIFNEDAEALVNTVNCVGTMGRGIALQFKKVFPDNFNEYLKACKLNKVKTGKVFTYQRHSFANPRYILNFPTKKHWKEKSKISYIEQGLDDLLKIINEHNISSVAIPPLGSGLGGLNWVHVKKLITDKMSNLNNVNIIVYEPLEKKNDINNPKNKKPEMTIGRASLIYLINSYLAGLMDPFITLLEVYKLMYFLQETGQNLRLRFKKAYYGPYAENLKHVMNLIEGHYIEGYKDGGDDPNKIIKLLPNVENLAKNKLDQNKEILDRLKKVSDLTEGFETPFGLELLSTVLWVVKNEASQDIEDVKRNVYNWSDRKRKMFTEEQIELAYSTLKQKSWI